MGIIRLKNMQFYGFHGVHESEKELGGRFEVDVELNLSLNSSCLSDDLHDTIDYESVYKIIENCIKKALFAEIADKSYRENRGNSPDPKQCMKIILVLDR